MSNNYYLNKKSNPSHNITAYIKKIRSQIHKSQWVIVRACESIMRLKALVWYLSWEWVSEVSLLLSPRVMQRNWRIGEWDCVTECVYERGEKESRELSGTGEQWSTESERELKIEEWIRWDSLGFCYFGQTVHFAPFFFEFWPESAGLAPVWCVLADMDRFNANWSDSVQVDPSWRESACIGNQKKKKKKDTALTCRQRRCPLHPESDAGLAAILPRRCIIGADSDEISFI